MPEVVSNIDKETSLSGNIVVDGMSCVTLTAKVYSNPNSNPTFTQAITNSNVYYSNREQVRTEIDKFKEQARAIEDSLIVEEDIPDDPEEQTPEEPEEP